MTAHVGGPETEAQVLAQHARYLDGWRRGAASMFRIAADEAPSGVGTLGYWQIEWEGAPVYEAGWGTLPQYQGMGVASRGVILMLQHAREHGTRDEVHAFPSPDHPASNGVCRRAGFELRGPVDFEYPKGNPVISNDWVFRLR